MIHRFLGIPTILSTRHSSQWIWTVTLWHHCTSGDNTGSALYKNTFPQTRLSDSCLCIFVREDYAVNGTKHIFPSSFPNCRTFSTRNEFPEWSILWSGQDLFFSPLPPRRKWSVVQALKGWDQLFPSEQPRCSYLFSEIREQKVLFKLQPRVLWREQTAFWRIN